jgi:proline dehydrogenase
MAIFDSLIARSIPLVPKPIVWRIARRYIAGVDLQDAIRVIRGLADRGLRATVDILGENVTSAEETIEARNTYELVLRKLHEEGLPAGISVKLTQMGLRLDPALARANIVHLALLAAGFGRFVRIDMEDSTTTTATLDLYRELAPRHPNVGIVLQAYLRRTIDDVSGLTQSATQKPDVRICKGIYVEPDNIALQEFEEIRRNFLKSLKILLQGGGRVAVATHDPFLVDESLKLCKEFDPAGTRHEFQMLYGVGEDLWGRILSGGHKIRIYVPFGHHWYAYSIRRLKENPKIAGYVFRAIFS